MRLVPGPGVADHVLEALLRHPAELVGGVGDRAAIGLLDAREDLEQRGHKYFSRTDSETILHLYEERGLDFIHEIEGDYGIAIWDENKDRLVLVRDRIGVKPLYFYHKDGRFIFASEIKAILQHPAVTPDIDELTSQVEAALEATELTTAIESVATKNETAPTVMGASRSLRMRWVLSTRRMYSSQATRCSARKPSAPCSTSRSAECGPTRPLCGRRP